MNMDLPRAIIFDMDDTILSDDEAAEKCWTRVCHTLAPRIGGNNGEGLLAAIREARRWYWSDHERARRGGRDLKAARWEILSVAFERRGMDDEALKVDMVDAFMEARSATVELIPGALDTLGTLRDRGVRLALITNGSAEGQRTKVELAGLEPFFESILIEGEFGVGKPDPQVFLHTLGRLNVRPGETWMVGDNLYGDVGGAQGVGIHGVWVDWRGHGLPENSDIRPDRIVRSIVELVPGGRG